VKRGAKEPGLFVVVKGVDHELTDPNAYQATVDQAQIENSHPPF